mmetsp:Transcript_44005/g.128135  ORF Transcript_44005/g.128135 Transcript_44005/m.128135 type:complete len:237 (-) Transcript_44005:1599-2309(-)
MRGVSIGRCRKANCCPGAFTGRRRFHEMECSRHGASAPREHRCGRQRQELLRQHRAALPPSRRIHQVQGGRERRHCARRGLVSFQGRVPRLAGGPSLPSRAARWERRQDGLGFRQVPPQHHPLESIRALLLCRWIRAACRRHRLLGPAVEDHARPEPVRVLRRLPVVFRRALPSGLDDGAEDASRQPCRALRLQRHQVVPARVRQALLRLVEAIATGHPQGSVAVSRAHPWPAGGR